MGKVILDMHMPKTCKDCYLCIPSQEKHTGQFCWRCVCRPTIVIEESGIKPDWCPLHEIPQKMQNPATYETTSKANFARGWNKCIDEIMRGSGENEQVN
jgi:hypothetical protein